jgi:uncharacterized tellurite resistance protein B-like protein
MSDFESLRPLRDFALLYLAMAQGADGDLSPAELEAVTDALHSRFAAFARADVQNVVLEAMAAHLDPASLEDATAAAATRLSRLLSTGEKATVLHDLRHVARADGVVLQSERGLLATLAERWDVRLPREDPAPAVSTDVAGALHHLAFLYLVLAHGTDSELSGDERQLILRKLQEWKPSLGEQQVHAVLAQAMERYGRGVTDEAVTASVEAVRVDLPKKQRMDALGLGRRRLRQLRQPRIKRIGAR